MAFDRRNFLKTIGAALPAAAEIQPQKPAYDKDFAQSFDCTKWAEAFVAHVRENPAIATDVGTMTRWFCNALIRGYDKHREDFFQSMHEGFKLPSNPSRAERDPSIGLGSAYPMAY